MTKRKADEIDWENEPCPLCSRDSIPREAKIQWIACESKVCGAWYHCACLNVSPSNIASFYCPSCTEKGVGRTVLREERPKRAKAGIDYTALDAGEHINSLRHLYTTLIESRAFAKQTIRELDGHEVTKSYLDEHGFTEPIVVHAQDGLGMHIPADLTVDRIAELVGPDKDIEVMDVPTQGEDKGWTLGRWAEYYKDPAPNRVRNVISLEVSDSELGRQIIRPTVVQELDIVDNFWPQSGPLAKLKPTVQTYCLMSLQNSYTDFHVDFAGTSVYYHILQGSKTFLFIPPSPTNLNKYSDWCKSADQAKTFLADECKDTFKVELSKGDTMLIPPGWIHAVHTPTKSLVIGGNFLHLHGMQKHLEICEIEERTKVPGKFRFPQLSKTLWFAAIGILARRVQLCSYEIHGAFRMIEYLFARASPAGQKTHKILEEIPRSHIAGEPLTMLRFLLLYIIECARHQDIALPHIPAECVLSTEEKTGRVLLLKITREQTSATFAHAASSQNGGPNYTEDWVYIPVSSSAEASQYTGSIEARGTYASIGSNNNGCQSEAERGDAALIAENNSYLPPSMVFIPFPDSPPPGSRNISATSSDAGKPHTTCFRCKTRRNRCNKDRPCGSCIEAGLASSCNDSGIYDQPSLPTEISENSSTLADPDISSLNQKFTVKDIAGDDRKVSATPRPRKQPKLKKPRKSARCTRCAHDKKMCGREEPMCDRCVKKGLTAADCVYPHNLSVHEESADVSTDIPIQTKKSEVSHEIPSTEQSFVQKEMLSAVVPDAGESREAPGNEPNTMSPKETAQKQLSASASTDVHTNPMPPMHVATDIQSTGDVTMSETVTDPTAASPIQFPSITSNQGSAVPPMINEAGP